MSGNSFGKIFKITTWGESHGPAVGAVIDGCPPNLSIDVDEIQKMLDRRKPNSSISSTLRQEKDKVLIMSGVFNGLSTGTPIMIIIKNKDTDPSAYDYLSNIYRPGHGDITYDAKYKIYDYRGGGRASARETAARVAAGAVANIFLSSKGIKVTSYTVQIGDIKAEPARYDFDKIAPNSFCCPDRKAAEDMRSLVKEIKERGDSIGGIVEILVRGVPAGLGEPVFDKLDADIAKAVMSIGAVKGVEIGSGFGAALMRGSENNDPITPKGFASNNAGGILAGISNGDDILVRAGIKPIPSIKFEQETIDRNNNKRKLSINGRHDVCAIPRVNAVCEAMISVVIADHLLRYRAYTK